MSELFFAIDLRGLSPKEYGRKLSKVFYALHGALHDGGNGKVGLTFPGWKASSAPSKVSLGEIIGVVSNDNAALMNVMDIFNREIAIIDPTLKADRVYAVPEDCDRVIFKRNRLRQKYLKMANNPALGNSMIDYANQRLEEMGCFPKVSLSSKGTRQKFTFEISMHTADHTNNEGEYSSYGLASGNELKSVPILKVN